MGIRSGGEDQELSFKHVISVMPFTKDIKKAAGYLNTDFTGGQVHVGGINVESINPKE